MVVAEEQNGIFPNKKRAAWWINTLCNTWFCVYVCVRAIFLFLSFYSKLIFFTFEYVFDFKISHDNNFSSS